MIRRVIGGSRVLFAAAACSAGAIALLSAQGVEAPRPAPARPAAPATASQPASPGKPTTRPTARPAAPAATAAPKVEFEKYTLPNGLQVILHVDRKLPIVHVNQWFHVGSKNEKPRRTGFAHLFEHMMFQGSTNVPGEYFSLVEKTGANIREGGVNGTTNNDRTNYFATVPSANLETLLWLESDRLATLLDATDQKKLDNQRDVVKNERRQSLENQPYGRCLRDHHQERSPRPATRTRGPSSAAMEDLTRRVARRRARTSSGTLLHAQQPVARDRRRLRSGGGEAPGREVLRRHPARAGARPAAALAARARRRAASSRSPIGCRRRAPTCLHRAEYFAPTKRRCTSPHASSRDGLSSRLDKALVYDQPLATTCSVVQVAARSPAGSW